MNPFEGRNFRQRQEQERKTPLRSIRVVPVTNVKTSNVTLFTVPDGRFFELKRIGVANLATGNLAVTLYLVPSGGSASANNMVYDGFVVWPNTSEDLPALTGHMMEPGDALIADTDDATSGGNFWLWGYEHEGAR